MGKGGELTRLAKSAQLDQEFFLRAFRKGIFDKGTNKIERSQKRGARFQKHETPFKIEVLNIHPALAFGDFLDEIQPRSHKY